jgi:hypothetical protein
MGQNEVGEIVSTNVGRKLDMSEVIGDVEVTCTLPQFCGVPDSFARDPLYMSLDEIVQKYYSRWASLAKEDVRTACLLAGWYEEGSQFEQLYAIVWEGIGDLGLESTTYESFVPEFTRIFMELYQETWRAYRAFEKRAGNVVGN